MTEALTRALSIEKGDMLEENRAKMVFPEDDDVIETLASHATKKPFHYGMHSRRTGGGQHDLDVGPLRNAIE